MALESYWPEYLRELREFRALAGAEEPELTAAGAALRRAPDDFYTATLTDAGCARWERLLGLPVVHGGDLAQRRFRIMTRMNEQRPFTLARLGEMLRGLCGEEGFTLALDGADFLLTVRLALTARQMLSDAAALLDRVVPVNLTVDLSLRYNQHQTLLGRTHAALAAYTHDQLRNEVLANGG